jgi:monofunctional glycosyltransferase
LKKIIKIILSILFIFFSFFVLEVVTLWRTVAPQIKDLKIGRVERNFKGDSAYKFRIIPSEKVRNWVSLKGISPSALSAIVLSEDWAFYHHPGIDFNQIKLAVFDYLRGDRKRGASTITQQVAKNLFLDSEQTITRKIKEILIALYMEKILSKEKILTTYFNIIHLGKGIYGIVNASKYYFNKDPSELNPREGAFLAMLLPSPLKYAVSFRNKKLTHFGKKMVNTILLKMRISRNITVEEYQNNIQRKFHWEEIETIGI